MRFPTRTASAAALLLAAAASAHTSATPRIETANAGSTATIIAASQAIETALGRIDLNWADLDPFVFGTGEREVVAFVAPSCPHCQYLLDRLDQLGEHYRFLIMPIALAPHEQPAVMALACAADRQAAATALRLHQTLAMPKDPNCDIRPLHRRVTVANLLGVNAVPFLIRSDGQISRGLPRDLEAWLDQGVSS